MPNRTRLGNGAMDRTHLMASRNIWLFLYLARFAVSQTAFATSRTFFWEESGGDRIPRGEKRLGGQRPPQGERKGVGEEAVDPTQPSRGGVKHPLV